MQLDQVARVDVALQVGAVSASVKVTAKNVLGISEHIARRHYAKWSAARQERISTIMRLVHGGEAASAAAAPAKTPATIQ